MFLKRKHFCFEIVFSCPLHFPHPQQQLSDIHLIIRLERKIMRVEI
jgi:hypothetical protein